MNNEGDIREQVEKLKAERLAREAISLENALFLRWFTCKQTGNAEYVARLASARHKAFRRVFRRQLDA